MHLTTTNPVPGVWRQNTRAGVILAISFTRLSRRNARISAHTMRMRAYARISAHAMRMRAYARISAYAMRMRAYARIPAHAMRMRAFLRMRCECAHFAHAMRMLAHARISPHAMRCDAMRMRACDAMRMRASRGNLCVSGTVYVDDTQLYMAFKPSNVTSKCDAISQIEACVADIRIWMNDNFLKLNDDKTETLVITTREGFSKISQISIKVGDQSISPSDDPPGKLNCAEVSISIDIQLER